MRQKISDRALVLRRIRFQEYHLRVLLLTEKGGLQSFFVFGGGSPRSRRGALLEPFSLVNVQGEEERERSLWQVKDVGTIQSFYTLKETPLAYAAACVTAEIVMEFQAAGDAFQVFPLLLESWSLLEGPLDRDRRQAVLCQFLWRFWMIRGEGPDPDNETLGPGIWKYLEKTGGCSIADGLSVSLSRKDFILLENFLLDQAEDNLGHSLKSRKFLKEALSM